MDELRYCENCEKDVEVAFLEEADLLSTGVSEYTRTVCVCMNCDKTIEND